MTRYGVRKKEWAEIQVRGAPGLLPGENYTMLKKELRKQFTMGGLLTLVLAILVAILLWLLSPLSFICTDQEICTREGTIRLPSQP